MAECKAETELASQSIDEHGVFESFKDGPHVEFGHFFGLEMHGF